MQLHHTCDELIIFLCFVKEKFVRTFRSMMHVQGVREKIHLTQYDTFNLLLCLGVIANATVITLATYYNHVMNITSHKFLHQPVFSVKC